MNFYTGPAVFLAHPTSNFITNNSQVQLTCTFNNYTAVSFSWVKYGTTLNKGSLTSESMVTESESVTSGIYKGSTSLTKRLTFIVKEVDEQGLYWCQLKDAMNNIVESKKASVKLLGEYENISLIHQNIDCVGRHTMSRDDFLCLIAM